MRIIDYFASERQEHWLGEIAKCEWEAGQLLYELLSEDKIEQMTGKTRVLLLTEGDELVSYCTYAQYDDIQPTELTPWMGFVYTYPKYRGYRYVGLLFEEVERIAKEENVSEVYISTCHTGLYEKYGCEFRCMMNDMSGEPSRVYVKKIR